MQTQAEPRFKKRVPCRFSVGGGRHSGLVLNVSRRGLFLQTSICARPGEDIELALTPGARGEGIPIRARVVWNRMVSSHLRSVTTGGIGLRIENASEAWYEFLAGVARPSQRPAPTPTPRPSASAPSAQRFRVRVKQTGGPRSRLVSVAADSEAEARRRALAQVGSDWTVLEAEAQADASPTPSRPGTNSQA